MGFFQKFYYGKAGQADFNPEDLPKDRKELFFSMLRIRFTGLISQNLIYLLFCLPAILVCGYAVALISSIVSSIFSVNEAGEIVTNLEMQAQFSNQWFSMITMLLLILVPCLGLAGVGATGSMYILRNWARDQHAFGFSDIKDSIKANWKQGLTFGLLSGVINLVCFVGWYFYRTQAAAMPGAGGIMMSLLEGLILVILCLWWMMNMIIYPMMITYDMKFKTLLRNCMILIVGRLPYSVGIWLLSLLPTIICVAVFVLTGTNWAILAWVLIYLIVGFAFNGFLYASYANSLFDKYLNPRIEGAEVNRGLRSSEYDEDEQDDDTPVYTQPGYRADNSGSDNRPEVWPPRRPDDRSWLDAQAERNIDDDSKANDTSKPSDGDK